MKRTLQLISVAGLLAATRLWAHQPTTAVATHNHLLFTGYEVTMTLTDREDPTTVIYVTKKALPPQSNVTVHTYEVTVSSRDPKKPINKTYSLLTLGLQAITFEMEITSYKTNTASGKVDFIPPRALSGATMKQPEALARTGTYWDYHVAEDVLDDNGISMVQLAGADTYTFIVTEVNQPRLGTTTWDNQHTVGSGHDNTPPGPPN